MDVERAIEFLLQQQARFAEQRQQFLEQEGRRQSPGKRG